jgi:hypothetical protein
MPRSRCRAPLALVLAGAGLLSGCGTNSTSPNLSIGPITTQASGVVTAPFTFQATVTNLGNGASAPTTVAWSAAESNGVQLNATIAIPGLAAGASCTAQCSETFPTAATYSISMQVAAPPGDTTTTDKNSGDVIVVAMPASSG